MEKLPNGTPYEKQETVLGPCDLLGFTSQISILLSVVETRMRRVFITRLGSEAKDATTGVSLGDLGAFF